MITFFDTTSITLSLQNILYILVPIGSLLGYALKHSTEASKDIGLVKLEIQYLKEKIESIEDKLDNILKQIYEFRS